MTVSSLVSRIAFAGNGVTTSFPFPYPVLLAADLKVYQNGALKTQTTHYTLSGTAPYTLGTSVQFVTAPAVDDDIVIVRDPALTQPTDFEESGILPVKSIERALDRAIMIEQVTREQIGRSFRLADGDARSGDDFVLSPAANWAEKFMHFDVDGNPEPVAILDPSTVLSQSVIAGLLYPQTQAETDAGATAVNLVYPPASLSPDGTVNVLRYGTNTVPGTTDMTAAFQAIIDLKVVGSAPAEDFKITGPLTFAEGGLIGQGYGTAPGAKRTALIFHNCTDTTIGALNTRQSVTTFNKLLFRNFAVVASSWDPSTGCLGYGMDIEASVIAENLYVIGFKKSNLWFHHNTAQVGPYNSVIDNVQSVYSGQHGFLVGNGANVLLFKQIYAANNGAPSYLTVPSSPGNYDGFHVAATADGGTYPAYTPESVTIIGGNCSFNSRYGWNIDVTNGSVMTPGYAEGNLVNEARVGDFFNTQINFAHLLGDTAGLVNAQTFAAYFYRNTIHIGGKRVHPNDDYDLIANPAAEDEASGTVQNAPSGRKKFLARSNTASHTVYIIGNVDPAGGAANVASEAIASIQGSGTYGLGIGSGSHHLEIRTNQVVLPSLHYMKTTTGWGAAKVARAIDTAAPVAGTWARGDIVWNSTPSAAGNAGWICVTAGTPGTWKTFGTIAA